MKELKYYKRPIYKKGKLAYQSYVAMDYLHNTKDFDIFVYIKRRFLGLFWIKVHDYSNRNQDPQTATKIAISEYEKDRKKEEYQTLKTNSHIVNFMSWDGELEKKE